MDLERKKTSKNVRQKLLQMKLFITIKINISEKVDRMKFQQKYINPLNPNTTNHRRKSDTHKITLNHNSPLQNEIRLNNLLKTEQTTQNLIT